MTNIKNIVLLGYPRTGSTYVQVALAHLFGVKNSGELFNKSRSKTYFGRNGAWFHEDLRQLRNGYHPELDGTYSPYTEPHLINIMTKHVHLIGEKFFHEFMNDPSTYVISIYREDLWQTALSHIIARVDDAWNSKDMAYDLSKYERNIRAQDHMVIVNEVFYKLAQSIGDMKRFASAIEFDKVHRYEDLKQDAYEDFKEYLDIVPGNSDWYNKVTFKKQHTEQQKEDRFLDIEFLEDYANEFYDMTGLKRYNTIDFKRSNSKVDQWQRFPSKILT